jgi:hopanoid biosynthesis associated protein HpnK
VTTERTITLTADDFGLSLAVNEAVERAHRDGVLTHASLMVAGPAAADAVARARAMPALRVGLHLVAVEGPAVLAPGVIPALVDASGWFPGDQLALGLRYAVHPAARAQLRREIAAQFDAFAATGLTLSHADAHKHMHLHPFVADLLIRHGARHGLRRVRVPDEPGTNPALRAWTRVLRGKLRRAGIAAPDHVFGLRDSGAMTEATVLRLLARMPPGDTELYFHPAARRDPLLDRLMPTYRHAAELDALLSPAVRAAVATAAGRA